MQDYAQKDVHAALEHLKKAEELDPIQPQVQAFLEKIQGSSSENPSNPLIKAREALKKGNKEEALAKLADYLDEHPGDPEALELKDQIEGKDAPQSAVKNALAKARKAGQAGKIPQAIKWYSKVLELDPKNEEAIKALNQPKDSASKPDSPKKERRLTIWTTKPKLINPTI